MISLSSQLLVAQVGLGQGAAGGFVILLIAGALALIGLVIAVVFGISAFRSGATRSRDLVFLLVGLALVSPALWLASPVFFDLIPRRKSWDFSSGRSTKLLGEENDPDAALREQVGYTYSGNIHSSIKLASNRHWSGNARSVYFRVKSGEIASIQWRSPELVADRVYEQTQRILKDLGMGAQADKDLEAWHAKVARGERDYFSTETRLAPNAKIQLVVTPIPRDVLWTVDVGVWWDQP